MSRGWVYVGFDPGVELPRTQDWSGVEGPSLALLTNSVAEFLNAHSLPPCSFQAHGLALLEDPRVAVDVHGDVHSWVAVVVLVAEELTLRGRHVPEEILAAASLALASGAAWVTRKPGV